MRLETAAAKFDRKVAKSLPSEFGYDLCAADMRELLLEAARRIKHLEATQFVTTRRQAFRDQLGTGDCGND